MLRFLSAPACQVFWTLRHIIKCQQLLLSGWKLPWRRCRRIRNTYPRNFDWLCRHWGGIWEVFIINWRGTTRIWVQFSRPEQNDSEVKSWELTKNVGQTCFHVLKVLISVYGIKREKCVFLNCIKWCSLKKLSFLDLLISKALDWIN